MNIMAATRKLDRDVSEAEIQEILVKAASKFGKIKQNEKTNEISYSPAQSVHRLKLSADVDKTGDGATIVTINGKMGISFIWIIILIIIALMMSLTVVGLLIFIWMMSKSQKIVKESFDQTANNALNML